MIYDAGTQVSLAVRLMLPCSFFRAKNTKLAGKCCESFDWQKHNCYDFQENFRGKATLYTLCKNVILGWGKVIGLLIGVILSWILAGVGGIK